MCSHHASQVGCSNRRCRRRMPAWVARITRRTFGRPLCIVCTPVPPSSVAQSTVIDVTHLVTGPRPVPVLLREEAL